MKKLALVLAVLMMSVLALPVAAASETDVLYGTPVIDGVLDEMYTKSASVVLDNLEFYVDGQTDELTSAEGTTTYMLWDENYLYLCTVVNDTTVAATVDSAVDYTVWNTCDNVEHYVRSADWTAGGQVHVGCLGEGLRNDTNGTSDVCDMTNAKVAATVTDTGYVVELALPIDTLFDLTAGSTFAYSLQYNDYVPADNATLASGNQDVADAVEFTLSAEKAAPEATVDTTPVVDTDPVEDPADAPATFDAGIVAAVVAIVSAAGYVVAKKK